MNQELKNSIIKFIYAFEEVFDKDWDYTKENLGILQASKESNENSIPFISDAGTFLNPKVEDEVENWGHRASLLREYRKLKELLSED